MKIADQKSKYIAHLQVGATVKDLFLISDAALSPFRPETGRKGSFMRFRLSDRTGSLPGIMWDGAEVVFPKLGPGSVVRVEGTVGQYRGDPQIVVDKITTDIGSFAMEEFIVQGLRPQAAMLAELKREIDSIELSPLRLLLDDLIGDPWFYDLFVHAPAAKVMHHAHLGGLLQHTLEVVTFARTIAEQYPRYINKDLLLTGALLHDCGKIFEYRWDGPLISITDEGQLFGHLVLGAELIENRWNKLGLSDSALSQELRHMILSHHGTQEWGSPQPPKTPNAFALHLADYLSSELDHFQGVLLRSDDSGSSWSPVDYKLGRNLYRGFLPNHDVK